MPPPDYIVRRTYAWERGRWAVVSPNGAVTEGLLTKWGAMRLARRWKRTNAAANRTYSV